MTRDEPHFPPRHAALREDVHNLGVIIGEVLREQGGSELFDLVEQDRLAAIRRRETGAPASDLAVRVSQRPPAVARDLVRAFTMWFQAVNLAEKVHRIRRRREYFLENSARPQPGGVEDALAQLRAQGWTLEQVLGLLGELRIEPVFTAHPTESTRRTILRMQQRVAELLFDRLSPTLTANELRGLWGRVRAELTAAWQTEDHPRERLTVGDEREHVVFYLSEVLYRILPAFYEEIGQALEKLYGVAADSLELPSLVHFGSWVGGDMDGNPDVHAKSIRETLARQQQVIVNAYFVDCQSLAQRLSQSASRVGISPALQARIEQYLTLLPGSRGGAPARHDRMPYRTFLGQVAERLRLTYEGRPSGYESPTQFRRDIELVDESLLANKGRYAGHHHVRRLLRRIDTFGFHLATLDLRQHSEVHHTVIARCLDDPQWSARTHAERHDLLRDAIQRDRGPCGEIDTLAKRTLSVFEAIAQCRHRYGPHSIGYYVVSGVAGADDVLAPLLLARWAETYDRRSGQVAIDIAPLFESVDSMQRSGQIMTDLLNDEVYRNHLESRGRLQCALVGYSDSSKESGICASRVATWQAQQRIAEALRARNERHILFHGRGGSLARGGGRIDALVRATPPTAVNGVLRMTEQGEVVNQSYGLRPIAMRTLERALGALCLSVSGARRGAQSDPPEFDAIGHTLLEASRRSYRQLVWGEPQFFEYFREATPIDVIERMQIGSRPAMRPNREGLEALRAVPWVFAWTQTRLILPGWYGAGAGLEAVVMQHGLEAARRAWRDWFFFANLVNDVEAMLARTDLEIAAAYNELAATPLRRFFPEVRVEYERAIRLVKEIKEIENLLDGERTLQRSIYLRNPYVDPMNYMQVDLLRRWRASGREDRDLLSALLSSISGIAQGLQTTG